MATWNPDQTDSEEHLGNAMECPICYSSYDNIFKTPLLLPCSHTFCMECLSRLCLFHKLSQDFPCPMCRNLASIPPGGIPKMPPNLDIVAQFPPEMQDLQEVWVEGYKLCWMRRQDSGERIGSLVEVHLLTNSTEGPVGREGLVSVPQSWCRALWRSMWGLALTIFITGIVLFTVIFLPVYMYRKEHRT